MIILLAVVSTALAVGVFLVLNKYVIIVPRSEASPSPIAQTQNTPVPRAAPASTPEPAAPPAATPAATPAPTVDLADLVSRMQDWPEEVTLSRDATFPGEVVATAGTTVKLITAGPEVEVEYQGQQAKLPADQTDLVSRVLSHRAQIAREMEIERTIARKAMEKARTQTEARSAESDRVYGREPSHDDAYYAVKTYLKQTERDPDSVDIINVSAPFKSEFGGRRCWAATVQFQARDDKGFLKDETGTAYLAGDRVTGYERSQ